MNVRTRLLSTLTTYYLPLATSKRLPATQRIGATCNIVIYVCTYVAGCVYLCGAGSERYVRWRNVQRPAIVRKYLQQDHLDSYGLQHATTNAAVSFVEDITARRRNGNLVYVYARMRSQRFCCCCCNGSGARVHCSISKANKI